MSPTRESAILGDEDEEEEDDEFGGQETLVTARPAKAEAEFSQQDTLVIREDQPRVSKWRNTCGSQVTTCASISSSSVR